MSNWEDACLEEQFSRRLLAQDRDAMRLRHYSLRTEQADTGWIKRTTFSTVCAARPTRGVGEAVAVLICSAKERVAGHSENQALGACALFHCPLDAV